MTDLELLLALIKEYNSELDTERIERAYRVTEAAHAGQTRSSGEPYVTHPLATAKILADLYMDEDTIIAALLHDVPEDTAVTLDELREQFGDDVAQLVDGVTKLSQLRYGTEQVEAESLRKMFLAMAEDIRVVLIKLADRLHNMRTLTYKAPDKQIKIARETLEIYAPLANRLGIYNIRRELEDLSLKYLAPEKFQEIDDFLSDDRDDRHSYIGQAVTILREKLAEEDVHADISGRPKHIYSIYKKALAKQRDLSHIYDIRAIRCLVQDKSECYLVLGIVHSLWTPIPGEFDDYIAKPKENGYQSLHTAVIGPGGKALEVQIRTKEMHQIAEYGVAAHWRYKEPGGKRDPRLEEKINWLRQLQDWRAEVTTASEFVNALKTDIFRDQVYVFTPKGQIIEMAAGATPIDFAYHIHTEVGNRCRGAKVNGKIVALETPLKTGDRVEILTAKKGGPSRDWLNPTLGLVHSARAKEKIRQYFRKQEREVARVEGRALLDKELHRLGFSQKNLDEIAKLFNYANVDELAEAIGYADVGLQQIDIKLLEAEQTKPAPEPEPLLGTKPRAKATNEVGLEIGGVGNLLTRIAQCCKPVPGDEIVGYISHGRGIAIHRRDCKNVIEHQGNEGRWIALTWKGMKQEQVYPVTIEVHAFDRSGLLHDLSGVVSEEGVNMSQVSSKSRRDNTAVVNATLEIGNANQLTRILNKIERLPNVLDARRVSG
ncbi:MAG: bifunctional (p)ppGpp synthetase/guanosine-3',5'-bis(diphosphate) 3'-pyrophosphohydrolase [Chloroflexota bacterium]|nr:MAG: bifunctional (p)ppGpp synthetase/guanosine-3',5'-bis(diphosphate) 3'-pyrophosphohydrolase [Chloroflexota bacterium]